MGVISSYPLSMSYGRSAATLIAVVVGTYGDPKWHTRACDLVEQVHSCQTVQPQVAIAIHADTLQEARTMGVWGTFGSHVIFLDADDELDPEFIAKMNDRIHENAPKNIIYRPSIRGFRLDENGERTWLDPEPLMFERHPLLTRNYLPIGSMISRAAFLRSEGFGDWECLEDWAFWLQLVTNMDAVVEDVPEAVYLINDDHTRNQHPDINRIANQIRATYKWAYFQSQEYQDGIALNSVRDR